MASLGLVLFILISSTCTASPQTNLTSKVCNHALGMENGDIKDDQLTASSYVPYFHFPGKGTYNAKAKYGRLNDNLAWCGQTPRGSRYKQQYFQVEFHQDVIINGLATQGLHNSFTSYYIKSYTVKFSLNGTHWFNYTNPKNKIWPGNKDGSNVNRVLFNKPVVARFLRIYPQSIKYRMCLRMEIYGCYLNKTANTSKPNTTSTAALTTSTLQPSSILNLKTTIPPYPSQSTTSLTTTSSKIHPTFTPTRTTPQSTSVITSGGGVTDVCNHALGMENGDIKDDQLTASSYVPYLHFVGKGTYNAKAKYGRLNDNLAWCGQTPRRSRYKQQYFQVEFHQHVIINGLATQGLHISFTSYYIKSYTVKFSLNGTHWVSYTNQKNKVWLGNKDGLTVNRVLFNKPVTARLLRIYPHSVNYRMCLRMEIYGCYLNETGDSSALTTTPPTTTVNQLSSIPPVTTTSLPLPTTLFEKTPANNQSFKADGLLEENKIIFIISGCAVFSIAVVVYFVYRTRRRRKQYGMSPIQLMAPIEPTDSSDTDEAFEKRSSNCDSV